MNALSKGCVALSIILLSGCAPYQPFTMDHLNNLRAAARDVANEGDARIYGTAANGYRPAASTGRSYQPGGGGSYISRQGGTPYLVDRQTGKYLGNLSSNTLDPNSVNNPIGKFGSPISPDSIHNPLSVYGSPISPNSPHNPLATNPPMIMQGGRY